MEVVAREYQIKHPICEWERVEGCGFVSCRIDVNIVVGHDDDWFFCVKDHEYQASDANNVEMSKTANLS